MLRSLLARVVVLAMACGSFACGDDDGAGPTSAAGRWYGGDFHVHTSVGSNDTRYPDGHVESFPEDIRAVALARGLSFVVLTDHSNSTGGDASTQVEDPALWNLGPEFPLWETAADLSDASFLMIDGNEISPVSTLDADLCPNCPSLGTGRLSPVGHIGCVPENLDTFVIDGPLVDRPPGEVTGGAAAEQCQSRNGFTIINHPFVRATPWIEYDWTSRDYDAIEVYSGAIGWDTFDRSAYEAYLCDRLQGHATVAVGGSDNHRTLIPFADAIGTQLGPPIGVPITSVWAEALTWDALMEGVRAGRMVLHESGTFVAFEVIDTSGTHLGAIGDQIAGGGATFVLTGTSPRPQALRLLRVAPDACTERRQSGRDVPPLVATQLVAERPICAAGACAFEERVDVVLEPGLYFATVGGFDTSGIGIRDVAVTNVLTVVAPDA